MRLIGIAKENLDLAWKDVKNYIEQAAAYGDGRYSMDDIYALLKDGTFYLWLFYNDGSKEVVGCMVTEILQYPSKKICIILYLSADNFDDVVVLFEEFTKWVKDNKCDSIDLYGRPGWSRKLKKLKFKNTFQVMGLDI